MIEAREDKAKTDADAAETRRKSEVDGLKGQLSEAEKKVENLQSQQIARRLKPDQRDTLMAALSPYVGQKVYIFCSTNAWDCTDFANDFLEVFKGANWVPTDVVRYGIVVGGDAKGVQVFLNSKMADANGQVYMPSVVALLNTLAGLGIIPAPVLEQTNEVDIGIIYFRIGRIPPK